MKILITICARGGSKGIPGKNIKPINGTPLIGYSINTAKKFAIQHDAVIALSTDSEEIKNTAEKFDLKSSYHRPEYLATDKAGKIDTINDVLEFEEQRLECKFDLILDLDVTSPLRNVQDLESALNMLLDDKNALNVFSVSPASRNPYFNMVQKNNSGYVELVNGGHSFKSRQEAPEVFDMNASFYIYKRSFFTENNKTSITNRSLAYLVPHICFDLDEKLDFLFMEFLLKENLLDFVL